VTPAAPNQGDSQTLRRATALVAFWEATDLVFKNYLAGTEVALPPELVPLLAEARDYVSRGDLLERWRAVPGAEALIDQLVGGELLLVKGSPLDGKDAAVADHWRWGHDARYFHYSTQRTRYEADLRQQEALVARLAEATMPASPFKTYDGPRLALTSSFDTQRDGLWMTLRQRRTRRGFTRQSISLDSFTTVLEWTWGATHQLRHPVLGEHVLKTSPSGGARHPIEVYPLVLRVAGVPSGLYHYSVRDHALESLRPGLWEDLAVRLCAGYEWFRNAAAVFLMTAVTERSMWKYPNSHAYRVLLLDAGHLGQTFHLVCTQLGLAPFTTAATDDLAIEETLGLDGVSEFPIYAAATGLPA